MSVPAHRSDSYPRERTLACTESELRGFASAAGLALATVDEPSSRRALAIVYAFRQVGADIPLDDFEERAEMIDALAAAYDAGPVELVS